MARTRIKAKDILDRTLTGASFDESLSFYDETKDYSIGDRTQWHGVWWEAINNITGTSEGDLSNAPDISSDWKMVKNLLWSAYPSAAQTFNDVAVTLEFDSERESNPGITLNTGEITFNSGGDFLIALEYTAVNTSTTRMTSKAYFEFSTDGTNWEVLNNTEAWSYNRESNQGRNTASISLPITVNSGDMIRVKMQSNGSTNITNVIEGCNISIYAQTGSQGIPGEQGPQGLTGAPGDIIWTGPWDSTRTYNENEAVEYLGSSYVSTSNSNTETPSDTASNWDLVASKGNDGSGTTINIADEGSTIPNTPHGTLNFKGEYVEATDAGSGTADITILPTKQSYSIAIWAEENASLGNDTFEWAFGNGANTSANNGISIFVPSGYSCEVVGMSLNLNAGQAEVELYINGASVSRSVSGDVNAGNKSPAVDVNSLPLNNGDRLNFKTVTASNTSAPNTVCAWLKYTEL